MLNTVLELSVRESVLVQCDHLQEAIGMFGPDDIWIQWLQRIQAQAKTPTEWERITWLWQHLNQPKLAALAHQEGLKLLDVIRQRIESENREIGIQLPIPELSTSAVDALKQNPFGFVPKSWPNDTRRIRKTLRHLTLNRLLNQ